MPTRRLTLLLATTLLVPAVSAEADLQPAAITQTVLFNKGDAGYGCYRIPAIVKTKTGALLAFAEARRTWCDDSQEIDLVLKRSDDDGRTWSAAKTVLSGSDTDPNAPATRGNPAPIVDLETGRVVLLTTMDPGTTSRPRTPYVQFSDDDGKTWSKAKNIADQIDDPAWGWYATGPVHGIQLTRGAHAGRLVAGTNYDVGGKDAAQLVYSDDSGETWHKGATDLRTDGATPQEISVVEKVNGGVLAMARNNAGGPGANRMTAVSNDGGQTYAAPYATVAGLTTPVVQTSLQRLRAVDRGDKYNRILFAGPADPERRRYLTIRSSFDEGKTWQSVADGTRITSDWSGYSDMAILDTGEIGLLYEGGSVDARDQIRFARFTENDIGHPDAPLGTTTPDVSGLGNHSYLRGGTTSVAGKFGQARDLDGVDDAIQLPFAEPLAVGAGDFTAMTWIKYGASTGPQAIFWGYNINEYSQFWLRAEPGDSRIRGLITTGGNTAAVQTTKAYNDNAWHHVALQRKAGTLAIWVDGAQAASVAAPAGSVSPGRPFKMYVGQRIDGAHHFDGSFDEVRLYKRALTAAEIGSIRTTNSTTVPNAVLDLPLG
ncbi:laminin G [Kribbella sandramycini]|uniref:exo-alpha-sialidase n=1 Tax=Kribbella sandramycini TaxID=60450 RepID=A0A7Y4P2T5_9ACTN|nr:sialidase family protein [Kribbella sandramycini]MBB6571177.1 sialidase-1 [Kribbella sandramycini]NOL43415.1 laminin G [Kribbella sandramycini]